MESQKANTLECPFVSRKCKGDKCIAWHVSTTPSIKDGCSILIFVSDKLFSENIKNEKIEKIVEK